MRRELNNTQVDRLEEKVLSLVEVLLDEVSLSKRGDTGFMDTSSERAVLEMNNNAYNSLANLAQDGTTITLTARDGRIDDVDGYSAGKALNTVILAGSPAPSSVPQKQPATIASFLEFNQTDKDTNDHYEYLYYT
ncbi:hypothetical protein BZA77DRAFT_351854 [Pyronema omphalodes]|nr:hypothetical protein BZA77DRAFT_351854 [Pyronema omphalodes]